MAEIRLIVFIFAFIMFLTYFSGLYGISILTNTGDIPTSQAHDFSYQNAFGSLITVLVLGVAPEFSALFTMIFVPSFIALIYVVWKALPFT